MTPLHSDELALLLRTTAFRFERLILPFSADASAFELIDTTESCWIEAAYCCRVFLVT